MCRREGRSYKTMVECTGIWEMQVGQEFLGSKTWWSGDACTGAYSA